MHRDSQRRGIQIQQRRYSLKNSYERQKFIRDCAIICVVILAVCAVCFYVVTDEGAAHTVFMLVPVAAGLTVICVYAYRQMDKVYSDIEDISEKMIAVVEDGGDVSEEFRQGAVGVLYSNFYKMVSYLRESRLNAMSEKIFLRDIISDISHQLKTPLASLDVFVDMLLEDKVQDPERRRQVLVEAGNQLTRMEWMVLSLLKLAMIEAGAIEFDRRTWNLEVIFAQAAEGVKYLTDKRGQTVTVSCEESVTLTCDGDWLTEALINLLKNASDYSDENTEIELAVEQNEMFTRIYVKDHGIGIPEKELPNIFKRFYRVNQEVNPNSVGIGLSLTKSIVEGMGGRITVRSEPGEYTTFQITFVG